MNVEYIRLCSLPTVQEKISEAMGEWRKGDMYVVGGKRYFFGDATWWYPGGKIPESFVRLPQVHDLNDEKRGLWGMVDWKEADMMIHDDGYISVRTWFQKETLAYHYIAKHCPPEIALLRACMHQWGIKGGKG